MVKLKIVLHLSMGSLLNPSVEFPLISECMIAQDSAGSRQDARAGIASGSQRLSINEAANGLKHLKRLR